MRTQRLVALLALSAAVLALSGCLLSGLTSGPSTTKPSTPPDKTLDISSGSENKTLEPIIQQFEKDNGVTINMSYKGSVDIMDSLRSGGTGIDAAWPANSIWLSMGNTKHNVTGEKSIMVTPVVLGLKLSKAKQLGWVGKDVTVSDILSAVEAKKLNFMMTSATQSNSGASAYLGFVSALLGHPDQITAADLQKPELQAKLKTILGGVNRSSGSSDFLKDLYLSEPDRYDAMINYEALIIEADKKLVAEGKEPLYVIYPKDGLALADSPLAYVDHGNAAKKALFQKFQAYLLSADVQKRIEALGRRTELGGVVTNPDLATFNPAWGVHVDQPLNVIRYPTSDVIEAALNLYQTALKKPSATVFALDYSGSMGGTGEQQVRNAMHLLLDQSQASKYMLQMGTKDVVIIIPFDGSPWTPIIAEGPAQAPAALAQLDSLHADGNTDIYTPTIKGMSMLAGYNPADYNLSVVLMTDGESNTGANLGDVERAYQAANRDTPVYSIMFGDANPQQLNGLAKATGGTVFDGKGDLVGAFKKVRGYN